MIAGWGRRERGELYRREGEANMGVLDKRPAKRNVGVLDPSQLLAFD
jgi:hypothetical protein